ncbi:MAG: ATP-binding cassette domain-containing protein [candidate division Zixibacteria bacterium]|nr:ATP-binding cassette domain-containing protein [candidate division Zixibacteria bacterium]
MNGYLQLDKITKCYGDKIAVNELELSIPRGCIYGIIGPNGAGKTTTIRMIMSIIFPDSGEVLIDGKPVDKNFKNRVGYLPEERGLYKKMTLKEVIHFMAKLKEAPADKINSQMDMWLEKMNLIDYKNKKVEELSKGMQQKLQFITTLIHEPDIIILDELFSGLDPINIELIKNVMLDLKKQGRTILFSTHVMEQAEKLCEYICMINGGKKVLDGSLTEIKSHYGKNSIHLEIDGDGRFLNTLNGIANVSSYTNYYELTLTDSIEPNDVLKAIAEKVTIKRFERIEPSLYNIFIELAGENSNSQTSNIIEGGMSHE